MELKAINTQTGQIFKGGLDQIVTWMETVSEDIPKVDAIANVMADMEMIPTGSELMADMEMIPTGSELMEEQLDKINRLSEEIGVEFLPVDED